MALWDDRGFNTARYVNIISAACDKKSVEDFNRTHTDPMDEEEVRTYNWAVDELEKAKKEGRTIMFDVPFDPDDRYEGIYSTTSREMYDNIKDRL